MPLKIPIEISDIILRALTFLALPEIGVGGWIGKSMMVSMKIFLFLVFSLSLYAQEGSQTPLPTCPPSIGNSYECAKFSEQVLLEKYPDLFKRSGGVLSVQLKNNQLQVFADAEDTENYGANAILYAVTQYYPEIGYVLIVKQYYEGADNYLFSLKVGKLFPILSFPVISPSLKKLASGYCDEGNSECGIQIFRVNDDKIEVELSATEEKWGAENIQWLSDSEFEFTKRALDEKDQYVFSKVVVRYNRQSHSWEFK